MNSGINHIYSQLNETFHKLLSLQEKNQLEFHLQDFREKIISLERLSDTDLSVSLRAHQHLIIQIFQFKKIAQDRVWIDLPKVRSHIGELIAGPNSYEGVFRNEVEKFGWGELLDYIKD